MSRAITIGLLIVAAAIAPWASLRLGEVPAVVTVMSVIHTLTSLLVAGVAFSRLRLMGRLAAAIQGSAYITVSILIGAYVGFFPGAIVPHPWPGGGTDAALWFYAAWHLLAGLLVIGYSMPWGKAKRIVPERLRSRVMVAFIAGSIVSGAAIVAGCMRAASVSAPLVDQDLHFTLGARLSTIAIAGFLFVAWLRARSVLRFGDTVERGVYVTAFALFIDVALCAAGGGRYTLGWYAARVLAAAEVTSD